MTTVTTKAEQAQAGRVARRAGGYSELIRLAAQRERTGGARFEVDREGRYRVVGPTDRAPGER